MLFEGSQCTLKVSIANFGISIVTNKFIPKYHKYHFVLSDENELVHTSTRTIFLVLDKPKIALDKILFCFFLVAKTCFKGETLIYELHKVISVFCPNIMMESKVLLALVFEPFLSHSVITVKYTC